MRDAFNTFSIRAGTDQQLLSELPDQGLLCLIIKKGYNIVDMTSIIRLMYKRVILLLPQLWKS